MSAEPARLSIHELRQRLEFADISPEARQLFEEKIKFSGFIKNFPMFDDQEFRDKFALIAELVRAELIIVRISVRYNPYETGAISRPSTDSPSGV